MSEKELVDYTCTVELALDGYNTQEEHDKACREFIYEQLNMAASCVSISHETTIKVSELREWCEDRILSLELEEDLCHYDFGVIFAYKDILNKFCGGK